MNNTIRSRSDSPRPQQEGAREHHLGRRAEADGDLPREVPARPRGVYYISLSLSTYIYTHIRITVIVTHQLIN